MLLAPGAWAHKLSKFCPERMQIRFNIKTQGKLKWITTVPY